MCFHFINKVVNQLLILLLMSFSYSHCNKNINVFSYYIEEEPDSCKYDTLW
jgi:hypothetical protein